jgi:phospholipid/cholesterol/gamma-HCH transport system substrate-binding protein
VKLLDKKTSGDLVRLLVFVVVTTLATGLLVILIGNISFVQSTTYRAVFSDVTGVNKGDDVRVAGVKVGSIKDIEITDRTRATLTFTVAQDTRLSDATQAAIRYRNLVGQRYLSLSEGVGSAKRLKADGEIPMAQTTPALDLTVLFNGFKPLFQALSPADINQLSYEIVQVFQGEGGTLESLLGHTASVTNTLASRDQVISALITNLNDVLDHLADRDDQLTNLITTLRTFVDGLKDDREAILGSLQGITDLSVQTADLVKGVRSPLVEDIKQLRRFAGTTEKNKAELDRALQVFPIKLDKVGRTAIYGSWFNFYLCDIGGKITLPGKLTVPINYATPAGRCNLG